METFIFRGISMIINKISNKLFENGKTLLLDMDTDEALRAFEFSYKKNHSDKTLSYILYSYMLKSDYKKLYKAFDKQNIQPQGMGLYVAYWYKFMIGEINETNIYIEKMLESDNYFLRAFALKELYKHGKITNVETAVTKYIKYFGLSYEMPIEEQRAAIYLDLLNNHQHLALLQIKSLVREHPAFTDVYIDLMDTLSFIDNQKAIIEILEDPIILDKAKTDYRFAYLISRELYKTGKYSEAKSYLKILLTYFKNNPIFYYNLANIYYKMNNYVKAIENYKAAIAVAPLFERAFYNLGTIYLKTGYIRDANRYLQEASKIKKQSDTLYNLSLSLIESRKLEEAYQHLNYLDNTINPFMLDIENIKRQIREAVVVS